MVERISRKDKVWSSILHRAFFYAILYLLQSFHFFLQGKTLTIEMESLEAEIQAVQAEIRELKAEINAIDDLLGKLFKDWTAIEKQKYGAYEYLRNMKMKQMDRLIIMEKENSEMRLQKAAAEENERDRQHTS